MKTGPILLIDDDSDECELIKDAMDLIQIKNELKCFANGHEALAYLQATTDRPFLILSDINMPVMGGIELRRKIFDDDALRKKSIPFIFLTTTASQPAVDAAYEMSVQGFFEKPHDLKEIAKLLDEVCSYWRRCRHPNN